jgi:ribonuclease HI
VGAYAVVFPHAQSYTIASTLPGTGTSIRAELQAAIYACETADIIDPGRAKSLIIYTDSLFVLKAVTT